MRTLDTRHSAVAEMVADCFRSVSRAASTAAVPFPGLVPVREQVVVWVGSLATVEQLALATRTARQKAA